MIYLMLRGLVNLIQLTDANKPNAAFLNFHAVEKIGRCMMCGQPRRAVA